MKYLVIGDAIIDRYTYAFTTRQSPEDSNALVWDVCNQFDSPGGCLNVASNLASLTGFPSHVSAIIQYDTRNWLKSDYNVFNVPELCATTMKPLVKERLINVENDKHIARIDNRKSFTDTSIELFENKHHNHRDLLDTFDAVIVSDYCKGSITDSIIESLRDVKCPVLVDTKREDLSIWADIPNCLVKINLEEYAICKNREMCTVIVTQGGSGAHLYYAGAAYPVSIEASFVENADCVGAGDAYLAGLADGYVAQAMPVEMAMRHADLVARASVRKPGTSIVTPLDIEQELWHDYHGCVG